MTSVMESGGASSSTISSGPSYRVYLGDTEGALKVFHAPCPPIAEDYQSPLPETIEVHGSNTSQATAKNGASASGSTAVQKMAAGDLQGVGWLLAVARRDATIDVISPSSNGRSAKLLVTIENDKMKAGLQRWVGLAVGNDGIYACTSAGDFTYTKLSASSGSTSSSSTGAISLQVESMQHLELPEPLQSLVFYPTQHPTHFTYGGEEIPLSLWDIGTALSPRKDDDGEEEDEEAANGREVYAAPNGELADNSNNNDHAMTTRDNSKQRKRKRQAEARAKAKELLWGEIWRAKNLPNDVLSLPQRPNVTSISILPSVTSSSESTSSIPALRVVVGTRDGLIRIFEPAGISRKAVKEFRVVLQGEGALKVIASRLDSHGSSSSSSATEIVAADGNGHLYAVDCDAGKVKYQWKDINGALTSLVCLPPPLGAKKSSMPLLFSTSMDRLVRLHSCPTNASQKARGENLLSCFTGGAGATAAVWDGTRPEVDEEDDADDASMRRRRRRRGDVSDNDDDDDDDDDEVWEGMEAVGTADQHGQAKRGDQQDDRDVADEERIKEQRTKKGKK